MAPSTLANPLRGEPGVMRRSAVYVVFAVATIAAGLIVHHHGTILNPTVRDILGDALWATMIVWWVSAIAPRTPLANRAAIAYAICAAVELSQRVHTPTLDAIRNVTLGKLILGSGFDPRDFAAYALGVAVAIVIELVAGRRRMKSCRGRLPTVVG